VATKNATTRGESGSDAQKEGLSAAWP